MHAWNGEHDEWRLARYAFLRLSQLESRYQASGGLDEKIHHKRA
jgi:hypothetical protein